MIRRAAILGSLASATLAVTAASTTGEQAEWPQFHSLRDEPQSKAVRKLSNTRFEKE